MAESPLLTARLPKLSPLSQRLLVASTLVIIGCSMIALGGWIFVLFVALILGLAAWEYWRMFQAGGYRPSLLLLVGGTLALVFSRHLWGFETAPLLMCVFGLATISNQVFDYKHNEKTAALDFSINLGGLMYIGWLGCYLISLRNLPDGLWWLMLVIPTTGLCDGGAYLLGSLFGRHKMAPQISPKKTWEGYFGGVLFGLLGGMGLAAVWHLRAPAMLPWHGLLIGGLIGLASPIGDLGESVMKRGFGVKDTSGILPGHGGVLDRIDSWLWAAPIGYYLITLLFSITP
jgi:phosphatidate cytidylyltransferase